MDRRQCEKEKSDNQRPAGLNDATASPQRGNFPKTHQPGGRYRKHYRWIGPEKLWVAAPVDLRDAGHSPGNR